MEDERVISFERGKQLADSLGLEFFETSAKENVNVRVRRRIYYFKHLRRIMYAKCIKYYNMYTNVFDSQAVFERLVDIICEKMSDTVAEPNMLNSKGGTRLDSAQPSNVNCNC